MERIKGHGGIDIAVYEAGRADGPATGTCAAPIGAAVGGRPRGAASHALTSFPSRSRSRCRRAGGQCGISERAEPRKRSA